MPKNDRDKHHPNQNGANSSEKQPAAARNFNKKEPPPHTRNSPITQNAEHGKPRSKR